MICPYCQQTILNDSLICPQCGRAVAEPDEEKFRRQMSHQLWRRILFITAGVLAVCGIFFAGLLAVVHMDSRENLLGYAILMIFCAVPMLVLAIIFFISGLILGRSINGR